MKTVGIMLNLSWKEFPMWRVGIELRRSLQKSDYSISVLTRLADHYNEDIQRSEISRDLLPLPLPDISDEEEVGFLIDEYEDLDVKSHANFVASCWWFGTESWVFVLAALLLSAHW